MEDRSHILVVEMIQHIGYVTDVLEFEGYKVATATNGAEGLDMVERVDQAGPPRHAHAGARRWGFART
jgi:CheY-like chemotaxis protein